MLPTSPGRRRECGLAAGATTAPITLSLAQDALDEANQTFALTVSKDASGSDTAAGTITGGGDTPPSAQIGDVTVNEGQFGNVAANFPVTLSGPSGKPITVRYSTGTARPLRLATTTRRQARRSPSIRARRPARSPSP